MQTVKIIKYGLYDSRKEMLNVKNSPRRKVMHFEFDFIINCDKGATSYINDKSCALKPNMLIIRKPEQTSYSKLHFKCFCLHLLIEKDSQFYLELSNLPSYYHLINSKVYHALFESLFTHIIKNPLEQQDYFVYSKLLELFYYLKKDASTNKNNDNLSLKKENKAIQKAIEYVKINFEQRLSLKVLGDLVGYTPNYFQQIFCDVMGVSPQKYIENVRLKNAKLLLAKNQMKLSEIAYACGFSSQSYFAKIFKKNTLLTPNEFRQKSIFRYFEQ